MSSSIELVIGQFYMLDREFMNHGVVQLIELYGKGEHYRYFCKIQDTDTGNQWETMCSRLSHLTKKEKEEWLSY